MDGYFLGPMNPAEFMWSFMPMNSQNLVASPGGIDSTQVYQMTTEKSMYGPFVSHHFSPSIDNHVNAYWTK